MSPDAQSRVERGKAFAPAAAHRAALRGPVFLPCPQHASQLASASSFYGPCLCHSCLFWVRACLYWRCFSGSGMARRRARGRIRDSGEFSPVSLAVLGVISGCAWDWSGRILDAVLLLAATRLHLG